MKFKRIEYNPKAFRRAMWGSIAKLIGVVLGAGAGSLLHQLVGNGFTGYTVAFLMAAVSLLLLCMTEYLRELE